jgi:glycosyltransferase involved in cell wall biosynthesis
MQIDKEQVKSDLVSFIVIAYNARNTIRSCIESILAQRICKQVILVDNNSTDGTADEVHDLPVILLFEPERCRGTARNRGLEVAEGDYVAFVDADVELPANWTTIALSLLAEHPDVVAVGGPGLTPSNTWVAKAMDSIQYGTLLSDGHKYVPTLPTMDIMYHSEAIRDKHFSDLWVAEDAEFNFHLVEEGYHFLWSRYLAVTHHHVCSLRQLLSRSYRYGIWFLAPYRRHPGMISSGVVVRVTYLPVILILGSLSFARPIMWGLLILWLSLPILTYSFLAFRLTCSSSFSARMQFVLVHSLKQHAQMMGIWAGILSGTGRITKRCKTDCTCGGGHE